LNETSVNPKTNPENELHFELTKTFPITIITQDAKESNHHEVFQKPIQEQQQQQQQVFQVEKNRKEVFQECQHCLYNEC